MWPILPCFSFLGYLRFSTPRSREEQSDRLVLSPLPPPFLYEVTYFGDGTVVVVCASLDEDGGLCGYGAWSWSKVWISIVLRFAVLVSEFQPSRLRGL